MTPTFPKATDSAWWRRNRGRRVVTLSGAAMLFVVGASVVETIERRTEALADVGRQANNLAVAIANAAASDLGRAQNTLRAAADAWPRVIESRRAIADLPARFIASRLLAAPEFSTLFIANATGAIVATGPRRDPAGATIANRDYFAAHRRNPAQGLRIDGISTHPLSGEPAFVVSYPIRSADGAFAGIIAGTLDATRLGAFYQNFDLGADGRIEIVGSHGEVVVRAADNAGFGRHSATFDRIKPLLDARHSGSVADHADEGGVRRLLAFSTVGNFGLIVIVGMGRDDALAKWRDELIAESISTGMVILVI
ncbi:MAG: hypothetical protein KIT16_22950 [Rhodospirillaceae bacterium]|nr:hypothetical protein [Rhodospirillaceae bacterium]